MSLLPKKPGRIDIGSIRRDQIAEAACAIIAQQGIQNLSLSEIEKKLDMSRGQLTYYFKTKEEILLAAFDRFLKLICQHQGEKPHCEEASWQELVRNVLHKILHQPPVHPEFGALQYTFLSQISHRTDFRERLATLYEDWRTHMADALAQDLHEETILPSLRSLATLIQAIFHGLAIQCAADPDSVNSEEMVNLCLDMLSTYLQKFRRPHSRPNLKQGNAAQPALTGAKGTHHGRDHH